MKTIRKATLKWDRVPIAREQEEIYSTKLVSSKDAAPILRSLIGDEVSENMLVLHLDTKLRILGFHVAGRGSVNACSVEPADIFREAIASGARAIILAHNHPSDDPVPSEEDIKLTRKVYKAGDMLGVELLDHIIVTAENHLSFMDVGLFAKLKDG